MNEIKSALRVSDTNAQRAYCRLPTFRLAPPRPLSTEDSSASRHARCSSGSTFLGLEMPRRKVAGVWASCSPPRLAAPHSPVRQVRRERRRHGGRRAENCVASRCAAPAAEAAYELSTTGTAPRVNWTMMTVMLSRPAPLSACRLGAMHVSHSSAATVGSDLPDCSPMRTMLTACAPAAVL